MEYFLEKIYELTPNINLKNKIKYTKNTKSLKTTQSYYNETKSLKPIEIKEFSFLYIILNKPELIKENYSLIENVKLFSNENKLLFKESFKYLT